MAVWGSERQRGVFAPIDGISGKEALSSNRSSYLQTKPAQLSEGGGGEVYFCRVRDWLYKKSLPYNSPQVVFASISFWAKKEFAFIGTGNFAEAITVSS